MDSLHIATAVAGGAMEFITDEKPIKSIHRTTSIKVISIYHPGDAQNGIAESEDEPQQTPSPWP